MNFKLSLAFTLMTISAYSYASDQPTQQPQYVAITSQNCVPSMTHHPFLLIIKKGDSVRGEIEKCVGNTKIKGASFSGGVGAMTSLELGYYDIKHQSYHLKTFNASTYEVLALNGNVSKIKGKNNFFVHAHGVFGDNKFHAFGGHVLKGKVSITVEILITPLDETPIRTPGEYKNFNPITEVIQSAR